MSSPSPSIVRGAKVVLGVIDDWFGIANERFRLSSGHTRFHALWLQGVEGAAPQPMGFSYGSHFSGPDINALLSAAGDDEEQFERLLVGTGDAMPSRRLTHGTHVADIFGGYDAGEEAAAAAERPIIGVAMPRAKIEDLSGLLLIKPVLDGIKYIIDCVRPPGGQPTVICEETGDAPPIVINLSYGIYGAACNGTNAFVRSVTAIMQAYNSAHPKAPLSIVTSAGNSYQSQGHAVLPRNSAAGGSPLTRRQLTLRILPDDRTPSIVMMRLPQGYRRYSLTVEAPGIPGSAIVDDANRNAWLSTDRGNVAEVLFIPPSPVNPCGLIHLTINPTADPLVAATPPALAPHGLWRLTIGGSDAIRARAVHAWIARDDAPLGYAVRGRQAFFEDKHYKRYDAFGRVMQLDEPRSAVQRGGSVNALGMTVGAGPVSAGGYVKGTDEFAPYSGGGRTVVTGMGGSFIRGPDLVSVTDDTDVVPGLLAAGTRSGSVVAMNGTSVAAPMAARAIADALAAGGFGALPADANIGRNLAATAVTGKAGVATQPPADPRLGHGALAIQGQRNIALSALRRR